MRQSVDDAAIFFLEMTLQLYKNSRGGKQISMRYAGGCVWKVFPNWMTIDSPTPPPLSLLLFPEPAVVQVLFKDSCVVLLLLLTLTTRFSP